MIKLPLEELPQKIYFFRHAESIGNALGLDDVSLQDLPNHRFPLTSKGISQANLLANYFDQNKIFTDVEEIYVSNFLRPQQTLEILMNKNNITSRVYEDSRLDEWWKGIFHSLTTEELITNYPIEKKIMEREGWHHYRPPQGESGKDVEIRLVSFLENLRYNSLISSHGRIGGFMKRILCGEPVNLNCKYEHPKNCELWLFTKKIDKYELTSLFEP
ncbi:MAG: histidine phosphatase family protein [Candidatus Woesearchaeota archaeon]